MSANGPPARHLTVATSDMSIFVANMDWSRAGRRTEPSSLYIVVHRSAGTFTHVYRVAAGADPARQTIYLEHVLVGEQVRAARAWVLDRCPAALAIETAA
ncbi:hypothetical protein [Microvirga antarctica]|uniref:hypothetical protein n=1 Tax=Microvirga antarctica TaxID=2819233 RepID=UPI001B31176C|nr:hypothetical protein [Microvirga antarctica]